MSGDLERFVGAQDPLYAGVLDELRHGRKVSHWMWFVFPQLRGLGHSPMAQAYAIDSLAEARAYLTHPTLGPRLRECTELVLAADAPSAASIFGRIDAMKLRSSMTLFARADPEEPLFQSVLDRYFDRQPDPLTEALLAEAGPDPHEVTQLLEGIDGAWEDARAGAAEADEGKSTPLEPI